MANVSNEFGMDFQILERNLKPLEAADESEEQLRRILTILTPANIDMVVYEVKQMKIDTAESLKQCVEAIFDAAGANESQSIFAFLCTRILLPSVPVVQGSQKMITFKEQILETATENVDNFVEKQILVKNTQDDEENGRKSCLERLRGVITLLRFIGDLFLVDFLPSDFMRYCVTKLLDEPSCNESTLEALCALLKIVGKKLEVTERVDLTENFFQFQDRKGSVEVSPHTRFMIEEIFAMRDNQWDPVEEVDWIMLYNLFLCDVEEKLYVIELWHGSSVKTDEILKVE